MSATPYQTYLAERLQSARGLGWEVSVASHTTVVDAVRYALMKFLPFGSHILRFWLGLAR